MWTEDAAAAVGQIGMKKPLTGDISSLEFLEDFLAIIKSSFRWFLTIDFFKNALISVCWIITFVLLGLANI